MLVTVASFLWFDPQGEHNSDYIYGPEDVRLLRRMVDRHLTVPHEFVCITDQPEAFDDIRTVRLDPAVRVPGLIFDKLMTFHPEAGVLIGSRILTMDLDCVVVGNMDRLVQRDEPLVLWRNPGRQPWANPEGKGKTRALYNTSMVLLNAGTRPDIWTRFKPRNRGGDQDWVSEMVGADCPYWDGSDGVYRLGRLDTPGSGPRAVLPENARVVFFPGDKGKPWDSAIQAECPWIAGSRQ